MFREITKQILVQKYLNTVYVNISGSFCLRYQITVGFWDRTNIVTTDPVIECDYRPIPICSQSIRAPIEFVNVYI